MLTYIWKWKMEKTKWINKDLALRLHLSSVQTPALKLWNIHFTKVGSSTKKKKSAWSQCVSRATVSLRWNWCQQSRKKIPQAPQEEGISVRYNSTVPTSSSSDHSPASSLMAATHCTAFQVELREQLPTPARKGCLLLPSPPSCLGAQPPCTFNCLWCLLDATGSKLNMWGNSECDHNNKTDHF